MLFSGGIKIPPLVKERKLKMYKYKSYRGQTAGRVLYCLEVYCGREFPGVADKAIVYDNYVKVMGCSKYVFCTFYWQDEVPVFRFNREIEVSLNQDLVYKFEKNQQLFAPFLDGDFNHTLISLILREVKEYANSEKIEAIIRRDEQEMSNLMSIIEETGNGYIKPDQLLDHIIYCLI